MKGSARSLAVALNGDPVLHRACGYAPLFTSSGRVTKELIQLKQKMFSILDTPDSNGRDTHGIAAPQLWEDKRVFAIKTEDRNEKIFVVDPKILEFGETEQTVWEGCLSFPHYGVLIKRPQRIKVQYSDENGKQVSHYFQGFDSSLFQHEYDHLEGITLLDRVKSSRYVLDVDALVELAEQDAPILEELSHQLLLEQD